MMKEETETIEWSETRLRVRYAETDQAGMVYHSNYLIWFEVGRNEHCRAHGFNYCDMETKESAFLPVTEANLRYRSPAKYDDIILIRTRSKEIRSRAITFEYEVRRAADQALLATGETKHIVMDNQGRARSFPSEYAEKLKARKSDS